MTVATIVAEPRPRRAAGLGRLIALAPIGIVIALTNLAEGQTAAIAGSNAALHLRDQRAPTASSPSVPASRAPDPVARWRPFIREASVRFGVPEAWISRVMRAESGGHVKRAGRPITSRKGAMGLMQLMPATWAAMRAEQALGSDPFDPRDNILAGTAYLAKMYRRFGYPGLFAAYNAGPGRYAGWREGRRSLPRETQEYLALVGGRDAGDGRPTPTVAAAKPSPPPPLFVVQHGASVTANTASSLPSSAPPSPSRSLFMPLSTGDTRAQSDR
ncbi:MAG: lytic transglycosylase [Sphingomonas sp.]|nr:lytic transglycosylase [Sphingomonas sp.]